MENSTKNEKRESKINNFFTRARAFLPGSRDEFGERKPWYNIPLAKRIIYFVLSLLLAVLLWGFVLMSQNPDREKTFYAVKPNFETGSEADLLARKLTVYGETSEILKNVNVTVSAPLTEVSKITKDNITATVSLNDVSKAGVYTLKVRATCTIGTVVDVEPELVDVTIDDLMSKSIPIAYDFIGELPEGYWHDTPQLFDSMTTVEGAKMDLLDVSNAVCHIELNELTESINSAIPLSVLDVNGEEVPNDVFKSIIPSVTVRMTVLPHKQVPIAYELDEGDLLTDIFEISEHSLSVEYLDIAAEQSVLDELTVITCDPVRLSGVTEPGTYSYPLTLMTLPSGCRVLDGVNIHNVQLKVVIIEKHVMKVINSFPITVVGEVAGYKYTFNFTATDVRISGPARVVQGFLTSDLTVILNVTGKAPGEYDLSLEYTLSDFDLFTELKIEFLIPKVHVLIVDTATEEAR